jgi:hypothetical protein
MTSVRHEWLTEAARQPIPASWRRRGGSAATFTYVSRLNIDEVTRNDGGLYACVSVDKNGQRSNFGTAFLNAVEELTSKIKYYQLYLILAWSELYSQPPISNRIRPAIFKCDITEIWLVHGIWCEYVCMLKRKTERGESTVDSPVKFPMCLPRYID